MKQTLLIVDDEIPFCHAVDSYLSSDKINVLVAHDRKNTLEICSQQRVDIILLDQNLPDGIGSEIIQPVLEQNEQCKIVIITAYPDINIAVEAIKKGAFDYLTKPVELGELEIAVRRALRTSDLEKIEAVVQYRSTKQRETASLVGANRGLKDVQNLLDRAARMESTVLLTGETGTGKNVAARAIHFASGRRDGPLITMNCAAVPADLIESELFGHAKGAFTGATNTTRGVFEMAEGGTLLLDEIGAMPIGLQSRLLSVLEDRTIRRVGSESTRQVDVRVLAATNSDLEQAITRGTFRQDLYYRLNVLRIHMPSLRERPQDIGALCDHFLAELAPGKALHLRDGETERLERYAWPGNVRELKNTIERSIFVRDGQALQPSRLVDSPERAPAQGAAVTEGEVVPLAEVERSYITYALSELSNNLTHTASALRISLNTLKRKMARYGLR